MKRATAILLVSLLIISMAGGAIALHTSGLEAKSMRGELLAQTSIAAAGVNVSKLLALSGSSADLTSTHYQDLKALMVEFRTSMPDIRFVYIVGVLPNGTNFFFVDSEPVDSPDYSPPGQVYDDTPGAFDATFAGEVTVTGPEEDRWGNWMTAMVPLRDPTTGEVVAVLGADMDAEDWSGKMFLAGLTGILIAVLMAVMVVSFYLIRERMVVDERRQAESAKALKLANDKLGIMNNITRHDINNQLMVLNGRLALVGAKYSNVGMEVDLQKARTAADRISSMIQFTKEYEDIGVTTPVWHDVRSLIKEASRDMPRDRVQLFNDIPEGTEMFADPLVTKVFHNLVQNAVLHGKDLSTIRFHLIERDGTASIVCEDDGAGISEEFRAKLFTKAFGTDHGFGLFLSREILNITGITITEEGLPGSGAQFIITPPRDGLRKV